MYCPLFYPAIGGAERQAELLTASLIAQGIKAEVLTYQHEPTWPLMELLPGGIAVRRIPILDLNRAFPRVRKLGLGLTTKMLTYLRTAMALRSIAGGFDVLHAQNASSSLTAFAVRVARRLGLRTVVTAVSIRDLFDFSVLVRESKWGTTAVRWLRADVDRWIAISSAVAEELRTGGIPNSRIARIPNGVSMNWPPNELPDIASHFLYLGRLANTAPRDIRGLIRAFEMASARVPHIELALVGGGDQLNEVRAVAAASSAAARIQLPGYQDGRTWRSWAHCLIQPSFVEGMSNALLEGMADGLACVAYDIPPNREALGDGSSGLLVPVGDHHRLAEALCSLATERGVARAWGERARARAERTYDIKAIAHRAIDLYRTLAGE